MSDIRELKLNKGNIALIDPEDYEIVNKKHWFVHEGYAKGYDKVDGKRKHITMHRYILGIHGLLKDGLEIDHINHNRLDNRKSNLRMVTRAQNVVNSEKRITNTSGYRGVSWNKARKRWRAEIMVNYKKILIGYFQSKEKAFEAYKQSALLYFGEYIYLK